jgi:hypothetical protein
VELTKEAIALESAVNLSRHLEIVGSIKNLLH